MANETHTDEGRETWSQFKRLSAHWKRRLLIGCCAAIAILGSITIVNHWLQRDDLAFVQRVTGVRIPHLISDVQIINDPALIHPSWIFVRCQIPRGRVQEFVETNSLEITEKTALTRRRTSIPDEAQSVSATAKRFFKRGTTTSGLPFEILLDANGALVMFVTIPD